MTLRLHIKVGFEPPRLSLKKGKVPSNEMVVQIPLGSTLNVVDVPRPNGAI